MLGSKVSSSPVGPDGPAPRFSYSYYFIMARRPLFRQVLPQMLFESSLRKAEKSFNIPLKFKKRPVFSNFQRKCEAKMKYDLQKVHNTDTVSPYFPVMIRPYPEEIDISHFSHTDTVLPYFPVMIRPYPEEIDISHFSLSFTTHTSKRPRLTAGAACFRLSEKSLDFSDSLKNAVTFTPHRGAKVRASLAGILA